MENKTNSLIFLVDDDALFLKALEIDFLRETQYQVKTFPNGHACIEALTANPDIIILDYHLDGVDKNAINGIQTLDLIKATQPDVPVIILSAQDKIEVAVECMLHNAINYLVKSETSFVRLQKLITIILENKDMKNKLGWYMDRM